MTDERAKVVAWLRRQAETYPGTEYRRHVVLILAAIERGDHMKGEDTRHEQ
ncbi:hypothetical protein [Aurantiacibacter spongiae]|uniref:hypothetical protein n=1 Tax=Aurantiacibacter spongiae TaxID=2488860 RepID=UPI0013152EC9|nr:hypothetical protein [Aurantiacibacter spongiae]